MKYAQSDRVRLGAYELDLRSGELLGGGQRVLLQEQPLQVLLMLVEREGELLTREEIQKRLWPNDTIVEFDHSINAAIKNLRRALGDSATEPTYIETLARRGYRLMVPVERLASDDSSVELPAIRAKNDGATVAEAPQPAAAPRQSPSSLPYPDAPIFAVGEVIAERYKIFRFIAKGGMGQVYEVDDLELKARVALKTIAPERASSPRQVDRFRQEIQLARTVSHPNVCRVFDLGRQKDDTHGEVLFLTMEFVPGETLSARLRRDGPMPCEQALPLIRQMVSGLAAAHEVGIVHRDFKPGNVMLLPEGSGPGLKITDFGLATNPEQQVTISGTSPEVVGTPAYMAPEQFRGQCSNHTDIYALGVTVFQTLTGSVPTNYEMPFRSPASGSNKAAGKAQPSGGKAQSDSGKLRAIGAKAQSSESETTKRIGQRWRDAITKAMAANPDARFETVEEFWQALSGERPAGYPGWRAIADSFRRHRWLYVANACALIAVIALALTGVIHNPFLRPQERHLAVLPFLNIGNDPTDKAFAEGISETLTSRLSQLERFQKSFWVVPAGDARTVKSPEEAHRDLDVTLAVTGSVQRTQEGVEVTTNLIDAANHRQLASRTLDVPSITLEDLQQQVWESVADMLDLQVPPEVKAELAAGGTSKPEAYRLYEEGNGYVQRFTVDDLDRAIECFNKALTEDPNFALAYAGLGNAYGAKYYLTKNPAFVELAIRNATRAVELNGRLIPVRMSLARVYQRTGQPDRALAEYKSVLDQDPTVTDAELLEGVLYASKGNNQQAEAVYKHAIARHPTYWFGYLDLGTLYYNTGRFNEAIQQYQSAVGLAPDNPTAYYSLGGSYIAVGRYNDAVVVLKKGLAIKPSAGAWTNLGGAYMYLGKWEEAADAMKQAAELSPHNDMMWRNLGDAYDQIPSRLADARQAYQKALELATEQLKVSPKDPDLLSGIALYHAHLGQKEDAEVFIARALQVAPNNSDTLFTSALVYEIIGHRDKALSALQQAAKAGYSVEEIDKEPELRALRSDPRYKVWLGQNRSQPSIANH
ncbi:MAG TPA: tetratricopeptide repeat protein [Candidatus Bathyarchaeia archaeon]|nr:tetratricopeptide repeat protein [Candidatus Bathyarchaeia archaeon]